MPDLGVGGPTVVVEEHPSVRRSELDTGHGSAHRSSGGIGYGSLLMQGARSRHPVERRGARPDVRGWVGFVSRPAPRQVQWVQRSPPQTTSVFRA